jgi:hypothetical protein
VNYRQRLRLLDVAQNIVDLADKNAYVDYNRKEAFDLLRSLIAREREWLGKSKQRGTEIGEGGLYSLPLRYVGGAANLRFETPDGCEFLLPQGLRPFLKEIEPPVKVERQQVIKL